MTNIPSFKPNKETEYPSFTQSHSDRTAAISNEILTFDTEKFRDLYLGTFKTREKVANAYPITIETIALLHKGGTKSYKVTAITSNIVEMVILRWGKVGSVEQIQVHLFNKSGPSASDFLDKKINEKMRRGYDLDPKFDPKPETVSDFAELRQALGRPLMSKLGPSDLKAIDPAIDTSGIKDRDEPAWDEYGNPQVDMKKKLELEKSKEAVWLAEKQREETAKKDFYKDDPIYGAF